MRTPIRRRITNGSSSSATLCSISLSVRGRITASLKCPEGDLTKIRSAIVRNEQLANFSRRIDLGGALRLGRGEASSGGNDRDLLLGSAFEALVGALFLDAGLGAVEAFVNPMLNDVQDYILDEIQDPKADCRNGRRRRKWERRNM